MDAMLRPVAWMLAGGLLAAGCSKKNEAPPPEPDVVEAKEPVETVEAVPEPAPDVSLLVTEAEKIADPAARAAALAGIAAEHLDRLLGDFESGSTEVRAGYLRLLLRMAPGLTDPGKVDAVVGRALIPVLEVETPPAGEADPRVFAGDLLATLVPRLSGDRRDRLLADTARLARLVATGWGCRTRAARVRAGEPVAALERALNGAVVSIGKLLEAGAGGAAVPDALAALGDVLRESPTMQDGTLHAAAADALAANAAALAPDAAAALVPVLVEGLFIDPVRHAPPGTENPDPACAVRPPPPVAAAEEAVRDGALRDGPPLPAPLFLGWEAENAHPTCIPLEEGPPGVVVPIAPTVARTLRRLAAAGPAQREAVIQELLRALAVEGLPPGMDAMTVAAVEPRERLVLRALPCGRALASHCEETATALRAFRESGGTADRAPCNGAANAAAARDFGPAPGRFWGVASALLADLLPPARSDAADPLTLGESLAVSVLVRQVEETDAWTARRERLLALAGRLLALPLDAAPPPADPGRGGRRRATAPSRAITALVDVLAAALPADESLLPDAALTHADTLLTALADGAGGPDLEAAAPVLRRVLAFARRELLPGEPSPADAGRGLWRTAAAVRALSRLGRAGPGDQAFHAVLRIAARMLGEPAAGAPLGDDVRLPPLVLPFGPVPLPAPGVYGRFDAEGNASAWVRSDEPLLPILFEALVAYQRPTSEALELLLLAATAPARVGHRRDAVIAALGSDDLSPERIRVRAAAADAFLRLFRRDASGRDAGDRLDRFEGIARWFLPLTAVEKGPAEEPVFALGLSAATPIAASPASPVPAFESVRDALVACVARPREDPADVARWEAMTPQDRTLYCQKHVEPWASDWARELRTVAVERRNIRDRRCWDHMQEEHRLRFEYCVDVENNREPQADLALGTEECRKVREEDESHADCLDLRYRPEFTTRGRPTVWGCYHRFPWLRDREPIGPDCPHLFQRLLAARMFVGFRTLAGAAAVDGIDADKLDALLPFESVIDVLREPERLDDETTLAALAAWAKALSEVEADVPAFRAPSRTSDAIAARDVPGREGAAPPAFVPAAWYEHPDWVERRTVSFSALWTDFLAACAPGAEADACAAGGGELRALLRRTGDDGAPGPFARLAAGTARVVEEGRLADALRSVAALRESDRCGSIPDILAACAARSVFAEPRPDDPVDRLLRRRSLHLLIGLAAEGTAAAAEAICRAAREFDRLPADLRPAARLAWYRIRPACAGAAIE